MAVRLRNLQPQRLGRFKLGKLGEELAIFLSCGLLLQFFPTRDAVSLPIVPKTELVLAEQDVCLRAANTSINGLNLNGCRPKKTQVQGS